MDRNGTNAKVSDVFGGGGPSGSGEGHTNKKTDATEQQQQRQNLDFWSTWFMIWDVLHCNISGELLPPQSTMEIPNYNKEIARTEQHFRWVSLFAIFVYAILLVFAYSVGQESEEELSSLERSAALIGLVCLAVTVVLQLLPLMSRRMEGGISGILFASLAVQGIAMTASALMAFGNKPPVLIDPVTGVRVHLIRWAEWSPIAFLMTFLVEGADAPDRRGHTLLPAYICAATQGISTFMGFLLPLCPNSAIWIITLSISFLFYFYIFFRLHYKQARFQNVPTGRRLDQLEIYHRSMISLRLLMTCAIGWTVLVVIYMGIGVIGPLFAPEDSFLRHPAAPMISEAFLDVLLKVMYMTHIVEMHKKAFDEGVKAKRRLEELQIMWDNSSDVLAISIESFPGIVTTIVSPTFIKMLRQDKVTTKNLEQEMEDTGDRGVTFEMTVVELESFLLEGDGHFTPLVRPRLYDFGDADLNKSDKKTVQFEEYVIGTDEMRALAKLMARSWKCKKRDSLLRHPLVYSKDANTLGTIQCEARVTRLEESALFVVVRDVSERSRRFEAEKLAISEKMARQKDSEANKFTRHEVKNGLLAALGLCDSLNENLQENLTSKILQKIEISWGKEHAEEMRKLFFVQDTASMLVKEIDTTLHEVLDTILAEAMARDVIHEAYEPHLERINLPQLLRSLTRHTAGKGKSERFPVKTFPDPFPSLLFDSQLLKCIHRNAVSNASKYGKRGEVVSTNLRHDDVTETLRLEVINAPGEKHEQLRQLGNEGAENVFEQGVRLHPNLEGGEKRTAVARQSSGDGAWIMRKCVQTLGGDCGIKFLEDSTIFFMSCPATSCRPLTAGGPRTGKTSAAFKFPHNTWGIAIDDSMMQRKLLKRFLSLAGINENRIVILGKNADEIRTFEDFVIDKVSNHPNDHFLLIVDENLDISMDDLHLHQTTISGSLMVQNIRHRMLAEQERQMFAMVRSANDSSHDIAIYKSRAHGFMPKAPFKKESIFEVLAPLWESRFSPMDNLGDQSSSGHESLSGRSDTSLRYADDGFVDLIQGHVRALDENIGNEDACAGRWPEIWVKLHLLKGDLSSLNFPSGESTVIIDRINGMRGKHTPISFFLKWQELRELVVRLSATDEDLVD